MTKIEELKRPERLDEDRIEALKDLFPEAFQDGEFNLQAFRELLEDPAKPGGDDKDFYGLNWPGKKQARKRAAMAPTVTLAPKLGEGEQEQTTKNVIIEGDNLEVMQALLKAYSGRIKLIYIDPPYNTGNDFVYRDDFRSSDDEYLEETSQRDIDGLLVANPRTSGRFHANWLNMIYPRLKIAQSLLSDDGVIFISIDDNEVANLKLVCDEIFGEENLISYICWQRKYTVSNDTSDISRNHEYLLAYSKVRKYSESSKRLPILNGLERTEDNNKAYRNPDSDPRGLWRANPYTCNKSADERPALYYPIVNPNTGEEILPSRHSVWRFNKETHEENVRSGRVYWGIDGKNKSPSFKRYLDEVGTVISDSWWTYEDVGHTDEAKREIKDIFPDAPDAFDTPKPKRLIERIIKLSTDFCNSDIILDFFAGSGTTGHATLSVNESDGGNRQFILIQTPENISEGRQAYDIGLRKISDVTVERVRRVAKRVQNPKTDSGFRVFTISPSNIRKYRPLNIETVAQLNGLDFANSGTLIPNYNSQNVITETMLLEGFPLDSKIEQAPNFNDLVYMVSHPERSHRLLISLTPDTLSEQTVEQAAQYPKDTFICLESSLTDQSKVQLADTVAKVKTL